MKVIRKSDARVFLDGPEVCREYAVTGRITFGSSTLQPGQTGAIDPGHPESDEIFYVSRGTFIMRNPDTNECYELHEGDIIIVPQGAPHELTNIGTDIAVATWSCAPSHIVE
ncbi:MAG: cupin domain-containing protein [Emergencia sp.]